MSSRPASCRKACSAFETAAAGLDYLEVGARRLFVPTPRILEGFDLACRLCAVLLGKEHVVRRVAVERRVEVDEVDGLVGDVPPQNVEVIAVVQPVVQGQTLSPWSDGQRNVRLRRLHRGPRRRVPAAPPNASHAAHTPAESSRTSSPTVPSLPSSAAVSPLKQRQNLAREDLRVGLLVCRDPTRLPRACRRALASPSLRRGFVAVHRVATLGPHLGERQRARRSETTSRRSSLFGQAVVAERAVGARQRPAAGRAGRCRLARGAAAWTSPHVRRRTRAHCGWTASAASAAVTRCGVVGRMRATCRRPGRLPSPIGRGLRERVRERRENATDTLSCLDESPWPLKVRAATSRADRRRPAVVPPPLSRAPASRAPSGRRGICPSPGSRPQARQAKRVSASSNA